MIFYLEDVWNEDGEADDIIEYACVNNIELKIKSYADLMKIKSVDFLSEIYFCNTDIVQYHLKNIGVLNVIVPDTYDMKYKYHYYRDIEKILFIDFLNKYNGIKRFIKPLENNKLFDGQIISSIDDFTDYGIKIPDNNSLVYSCKPIKILSEVRLLIGNGKIYGHSHMCKEKNNSYLDDKNFIDDIILITGNTFKCIDIGYIYNKEKCKFLWCIIEINPPFSLDDYAIPINDYINFCIYNNKV